MVTAVVRTVPVPELGLSGKNTVSNKNLPPAAASFMPMGMQPIDLGEESKTSPRLLAPLSLAPIASKSKATLQPLTLPSAQLSGNNFESKLSQIPNVD